MRMLQARSLRIVVVFAMSVIIGASRQGYAAPVAPFPAGAVRAFTDADRVAAMELLDTIDAARDEWRRLPIEERQSYAGRQRLTDLGARYANVAEICPNTQFAALAIQNSMGLYESVQDTRGMLAAYRRILEGFPNTRFEMEAHMDVGLYCLQTHNLPQLAAEYFRRVPHPDEVEVFTANRNLTLRTEKEPGRLSEAESYYVNARLHVVKCHLLLGGPEAAEKQTAELQAEFPEAQEWIASTVRAFNVEIFSLPKDETQLSEYVQGILPDLLFEAAQRADDSTMETPDAWVDGQAADTSLAQRPPQTTAGRVESGIRPAIQDGPTAGHRSTVMLGYLVAGLCFVGAAVLEVVRRAQRPQHGR